MTDTKTFIKSVAIAIMMFFTLPLAANHHEAHEEGEGHEESTNVESVQNHEAVHLEDKSHDAHETGKFVPGDFIMGHIADAYEWHILDKGDFHLSIPLPVIVYSQTSGFNVFMSSNFHHGHADYKNFRISPEGDNKGKVVEIIEGKEVLPIDISITKNVLALFVSVILIMWIFFGVAKTYAKNPNKAPKGMQSLMEPLIVFVRDDIAKSSIGEKNYMRFTPYLLTVFFFIFINNLLGLIPIFPFGANLTGNISVTLVLALLTFIITTFVSNKNYWTHIINAPGVPWWLKFPIPLMPVVELMGVFIKPFVLMVRLFANITAGHIIALGFYSLIFIFGEMNVGLGYGVSVVSIAFTIFMTILELLVALIQAYVFTLLSALYFAAATEEAH